MRRELGYGTPYLLSLGLSEQLTSLVWLAGPISGLVAQPLIGAISDSSTSRYRRRYWIVAATILLVFSGLGLAFTEPVAGALVDLFGGGQGDWDPRHKELVGPFAAGSQAVRQLTTDRSARPRLALLSSVSTASTLL